MNTSGGYERRIIISLTRQGSLPPALSVEDLADILEMNTKNAGGGYVEIGGEQLVIRAASRVSDPAQIARIPLKFGGGVKPIILGEVAAVSIGTNYRTGASTDDGLESLVGAAIMLAGENSRLVASAVREKLQEIQAKLPEESSFRAL